MEEKLNFENNYIYYEIMLKPELDNDKSPTPRIFTVAH